MAAIDRSWGNTVGRICGAAIPISSATLKKTTVEAAKITKAESGTLTPSSRDFLEKPAVVAVLEIMPPIMPETRAPFPVPMTRETTYPPRLMPTIRTTDDYFNATVAAATEEAKDIIAMALHGLLEQSASDPGE